jgi:hypothetical protein
MKYAVQIGSGVIIFTASFIKIGSSIQTLMGKDKKTYIKARAKTFLIFRKCEK